MYPLPAHAVDLVLQYISPLSDPIPPHLISLPLRQRHHFLRLSPNDHLEYICWPSLDNSSVSHLLDHLPPPSNKSTYPIRYTSDSESTFAHVQISSDPHDLRMLFLWDDGWKYHDLRLMPFPAPSFSTPQEAAESVRSPSPDPLAQADHDQGGSDDSYWDAYAAGEHGSPLAQPCTSTSGVVQGEDAYWARYASVQGSADSTIPSPMPTNRKLRHASSTDDPSRFSLQNECVINVPIDTIHSRSLLHVQDPPSPDMLADLLGKISPRKNINISLDDPCPLRSPSPYSSDPSPGQTATESEVITPPLHNYLDPTIVSPVPVKLTDVSRIALDEAEDKALTDSIKGLYCLWKAGRKGEHETDRSVFLKVVQAAIPYE